MDHHINRLTTRSIIRDRILPFPNPSKPSRTHNLLHSSFQ